MATWIFERFRRNEFSKRKEGDPNEDYCYDIRSIDRQQHIGSGAPRHMVEVLLAFFGVTRLEEIEGRTFTTPDDNPRWGISYAFQLLLLQARSNEAYVAPSHDALRERAIVALARMECPSFNDVDGMTRMEAIDSAWGDPRFDRPCEAHADWVARLNEDLGRASDGTVHIEQTTEKQRDEFPSAYACNCVCHAYLYLVRGATRRKLIYHMGGSFRFDDVVELPAAKEAAPSAS
ncbi:MAG: hypothetical protein Q8R16_03510 [bacterium]|nr:hypothetical protein [bacterium]